MRKYETPYIEMIKYDLDRMIMEGFGGDEDDNPWGNVIDPTTTSAGSTGGGIALKF